MNRAPKIAVKKQLYLIFFCIFVPFLVINISLLLTAHSLMLNHYKRLVELDRNRVASVLFDITTNTYNLSEAYVSDPDLIQMFGTHYLNEKEYYSTYNQNDLFAHVLKNEPMINAITVYTSNLSIPENTYVQHITPQVKEEDWYDLASGHSKPFWSTSLRTDFMGTSYRELCLYRRILLPQYHDFVIIKFTINNNYLKNRLESGGMDILISLEGDSDFYCSPRLSGLSAEDISVPKDSTAADFVTARGLSAIGMLSFYRPYQTDSVLKLFILNFKGPEEINHIILTYSLIILVVCITLFVTFQTFEHYFNNRLQVIRQAMHQASVQDYTIVDSLSGEDEFSRIFSDLKQLICQIRNQEKAVYQIQLEKEQLKTRQQEMEFKVLASQINPHFLYNTLETIRMKALTAGNREVATAIKLLSKTMRYVLSNTGTVAASLDRELDYIETYLAIQKLRFPQRFSYDLAVSPDILPENVQILPLLLQPVVENSIRHGLEALESGGVIHIAVSGNDSDALLISISDNGCGMEEERLKEVLRQINTRSEDRTASIGLSNIQRRIQLYYGLEYGLSISSSPHEGTLVTIRLPLIPISEDYGGNL